MVPERGRRTTSTTRPNIASACGRPPPPRCPFLFVLNFAPGVRVWTSPLLLFEPNTCFVYVSLFCPSVQKSCNPPPVSSISKGVAIIPNGVARIANGVARITLVLPRSHEFLMIGGITKLVWGSVARFVWFVCASFCFMCGFVSLCFVLCLVVFVLHFVARGLSPPTASPKRPAEKQNK